MPEIIPVAPDLDGDAPNVSARADGAGGGSLDQDVFSDMESRLEKDGGAGALGAKASDKVELDKADLPMDWGDDEAGEETPSEVKVDLADEPADDWDDMKFPEEDGDFDEEEEEEEGGKGRGLWLILALAGSVVVAAGAAVMVWLGAGELQKVETAQVSKPWFFEAPMPDAETALRLNLKPFIVPLIQSKEGGRVLRVAVSLEVADPPSRDDLTEKTRLCRDVIYRVLRDRPARGGQKLAGEKALAGPDQGRDQPGPAAGRGLPGVFHRFRDNRVRRACLLRE